MPENKKLFLLDAMALIYRAYYALNRNPRVNSRGLNTSAILGFANTFTEVIKKEAPTHLAVAFDHAGQTIREEGFSEYKANRQETPEDIILSIPYITRLLEAFRIPVLISEGYEADDIIGTLAKKAEKEGFDVFMMTSDKDFGQLVSEKVFMYKPGKTGTDAEIWGVREVCERFGISRPGQLIDILGLWGDASDNIPGVPGIGEKKAKNLIGQFGSIENLLKNLDQVKEPRIKENLAAFSDQALMSKNLATIILDAPVSWDEPAFRLKSPDPEKLIPLLDELEFRTFARRIFTDKDIMPPPEEKKPAPAPVPASGQMDLFSSQDAFADPVESGRERMALLMKEKDYIRVQDEEALRKLARELEECRAFCFDTETTGLDVLSDHLVGMAFCTKPGKAWFVPLPAEREKVTEILEHFRSVFENPEIEKTGQNLKFDIAVLRNYGIRVSGKLFDTMLAHYLLQPDMRHNLDVLAETYLNYTPVGIEALIGKKGKSQKSMRDVPLEDLTVYACEDADVCQQLREVFEPMLQEKELTGLFHQIETPLIPVLAQMEHEGVRIDREALDQYSLELQHRISELENAIFELAGTTFNIASPKQMGEILFDKLKIDPKAKKTKTKQYSTSEDVLTRLESRHPIIKHILDYRSLAKLKSTYADALPRLINPFTGRIHTSYNQAVAATGRLSSNNPNLQNIPIRTEEGRTIRKAFVPRNEDYILMAADYSQIELRIIAEMSKDQAMLEAFHSGRDIHAATAARVFDVPIEEVSKDMRRSAKTVNFGIVYGISAFGLSERLNIPKKEAADIIHQYFDKYPGIKEYMDKTIEFARKNEYVTTIFGRRRYISGINSSNGVVRGYAERNAINAPIQGSAADMIKMAMISIFKNMEAAKLKSKMILQVHDELVFDVLASEVDILKPLIENGMKYAANLSVPIEIDISTGKNWLEAH